MRKPGGIRLSLSGDYSRKPRWLVMTADISADDYHLLRGRNFEATIAPDRYRSLGDSGYGQVDEASVRTACERLHTALYENLNGGVSARPCNRETATYIQYDLDLKVVPHDQLMPVLLQAVAAEKNTLALSRTNAVQLITELYRARLLDKPAKQSLIDSANSTLQDSLEDACMLADRSQDARQAFEVAQAYAKQQQYQQAVAWLVKARRFHAQQKEVQAGVAGYDSSVVDQLFSKAVIVNLLKDIRSLNVSSLCNPADAWLLNCLADCVSLKFVQLAGDNADDCVNPFFATFMTQSRSVLSLRFEGFAVGINKKMPLGRDHFEMIAQVLRQNRSLTHLNLSSQKGLGDDELQELIDALSANPHNQLASIDLQFCYGLSRQGEVPLWQYMNRDNALEEVTPSHGVTPYGAQQYGQWLRERNPVLSEQRLLKQKVFGLWRQHAAEKKQQAEGESRAVRADYSVAKR